jgi:hypothetical protein
MLIVRDMIKKPHKRQEKYWDKILMGYGLGEGTGRSSKVDLVGHTNELELEEIKQVSKKTKKVRPKGRGPE